VDARERGRGGVVPQVATECYRVCAEPVANLIHRLLDSPPSIEFAAEQGRGIGGVAVG